uniref:Uncharacterized protein n=1 Tax=Palpitomonas bilix TaxID=652834 RepID=A0A7S3G6C7_9EUKA|mmetsp:Transcript_22960/g.58237  ORF Transcript_22960/g.58237 Transcript_22960/m.58237 type:complete len:163 (+) Transcript_22960:249-737(+)
MFLEELPLLSLYLQLIILAPFPLPRSLPPLDPLVFTHCHLLSVDYIYPLLCSPCLSSCPFARLGSLLARHICTLLALLFHSFTFRSGIFHLPLCSASSISLSLFFSLATFSQFLFCLFVFLAYPFSLYSTEMQVIENRLMKFVIGGIGTVAAVLLAYLRLIK